MSPRAARRGGRAERKSPGPNATLSLWGEPGQPEGYDPGAPTGPLELAELARRCRPAGRGGAAASAKSGSRSSRWRGQPREPNRWTQGLDGEHGWGKAK